MRGATVKETLYLASEHGRHSVFETQIARPPDRIFFADTMIFVVHDPTSFQLLYISCINKGNLPTYLPTNPPTYIYKEVKMALCSTKEYRPKMPLNTLWKLLPELFCLL